MAAVDPGLPIISIRTLKVATQVQLIGRLTSLFGVLSLVLASVGLYGITAYNVGRRAGETRQLYGFNPYKPVTLLLPVIVFAGFGLVATLLPALWASTISPARALRTG